MIDKYRKNKEKQYILLALVIGMIVTFTTAFTTRNYTNEISTDIANSLLRLHVRANSNSEEDQKLKLKVRDAILKEFKYELSNSQSKEELIKTINKNEDKIIKVAKDVIEKNGYNYDVNLRIDETYIETRQYGDVYLPAGIYDALIIEIGSGEGDNWWCVLFPPLCYVEPTQSISDRDREILKSKLTKEEYDIITNDNDIDIQIKFKLVEMFNNEL